LETRPGQDPSPAVPVKHAVDGGLGNLAAHERFKCLLDLHDGNHSTLLGFTLKIGKEPALFLKTHGAAPPASPVPVGRDGSGVSLPKWLSQNNRSPASTRKLCADSVIYTKEYRETA